MKKIIIVDDSAILRTTIKNALTGAGFEVLGAADGSAALHELLSKGPLPDLLLLDMFFPDENGLDILRGVKAKYPAINVLVITAVNRAALNKEIKAAGAADVLHKPFDLDDLLSAINKI